MTEAKTNPDSGYLELIIGPMFSGKTSEIIEIYKKCTFCNIPVTVINHTIDDTNEDTLVRCLFSGVMQLNQLINDRKQRVYVHSTSSMTRAPTLVILYLCLFVLTDDWENP
jgi:thymidine kinase